VRCQVCGNLIVSRRFEVRDGEAVVGVACSAECLSRAFGFSDGVWALPEKPLKPPLYVVKGGMG
jgi:hypothetical protein